MTRKRTNDTKSTARHVRVVLSKELFKKLQHVAVEREIKLGALLIEAAWALAEKANQ